MVVYAHLLDLFYVWCFCPLDNLVFETHLYRNHIYFLSSFLCVGVLQGFHHPLILGAAVQLGCLLSMNMGIGLYICKHIWCNALSA